MPINYGTLNVSTSGALIAGSGSFLATVTTSETINAPSGVVQTINLNTGNHQTLDLGLASGDVTATLAIPSASSAGTIIVLQGSTVRNITWVVSSGSIIWMGGQPYWPSDAANSSRILAWRWNGSVMRLAPSESS